MHGLRIFLRSYLYTAVVMKSYIWDITPCSPLKPITVAARSKACHVVARSNARVMGSYPSQGMDVCVYSVFVLTCV
jgi:hypothetical protein